MINEQHCNQRKFQNYEENDYIFSNLKLRSCVYKDYEIVLFATITIKSTKDKLLIQPLFKK